jgi:hypothetical protein
MKNTYGKLILKLYDNRKNFKKFNSKKNRENK